MNITTIINGLTKTLSIIEKALPLITKIKPIINVKETKKESNNGLPTFFQ